MSLQKEFVIPTKDVQPVDRWETQLAYAALADCLVQRVHSEEVRVALIGVVSDVLSMSGKLGSPSKRTNSKGVLVFKTSYGKRVWYPQDTLAVELWAVWKEQRAVKPDCSLANAVRTWASCVCEQGVNKFLLR